MGAAQPCSSCIDAYGHVGPAYARSIGFETRRHGRLRREGNTGGSAGSVELNMNISLTVSGLAS